MSKGDKEEEIWDLYDENRIRTGKTHRRKDEMQEGEYHLVVHICIFNSNNELLVQRRQVWKNGWPNMWDLSAAGSAIQGEDSKMAAIREVKEELGIDINLDGIRPSFTINFNHGFDDYYFITKDVDIKDITLQQEEVRDAKWINEEEMIKLVNSGEMIPYFFINNIFRIKDAYGIRTEKADDIKIQYATLDNLNSWMNLVEIEKEYFPGLESEKALLNHKNTVKEFINNHEAICALIHNQVIGNLLFSKKDKMLYFVAVHPNFRRQNIATKLIVKMLQDYEEDEIYVDTYRQDDTKGKEARALYNSLGFKSLMLSRNFDYNTERLVLNIDK